VINAALMTAIAVANTRSLRLAGQPRETGLE
jgi:hypothetical protein